MRRLAVGLLAASMLVGCADQTAVKRAEVQKSLDTLVEEFNLVNRGMFSDAPLEDSATARQAQLAETASKLQALMSDITPDMPGQRLMARQLIADAAAAQAYHAMQNGVIAASVLDAQAIELLGKVQEIHSLHHRVQRLSIDESGLLEQLRVGNPEIESAEHSGGLEPTRAFLETLRQQRSAKAGEIAAVQREVEEKQQRIDTLRGQSQDLRRDAFISESRERDDQNARAGELERQAEMIESEMNVLLAKQSGLDGELSNLDMRVEHAEEIIEDLQTHTETVTTRMADRARARDEQIALRDEAVAQLRRDAEVHLSAFDERVSTPMELAAQKLEGAIDNLTQAGGGSGDARAVRADIVSKRVLLADMLSQYAVALASKIQTFELIERDTTNLGVATSLNESIEQLRNRLHEVVSDVTAAVEAGETLAAELDQQVRDGEPLKEQLTKYARAFDAARVRTAEVSGRAATTSVN